MESMGNLESGKNSDSILAKLYNEESGERRDIKTILSEAGALELEFIHGEAAHELSDEDRIDMVKRAESILKELTTLIDGHNLSSEVAKVAETLKNSIASFVPEVTTPSSEEIH
jgi:hypothetical protein